MKEKKYQNQNIVLEFLQLCNSSASENEQNVPEWMETQPKEFVFISIVVMLLPNNKRAIAREDVSAYVKALEMYMT